MRLLLDTHVFLWYISGDDRLPATYADAIRDPAHEVYLSAASIREAVIKSALGRLPLPASPATYLPQQRAAHQMTALPIEEGAMAHLATLPPLHRDPFDRMLIAQALQHNLIVLTVDDAIRAYGVAVLATC